jgi:Protein of unknown function (DUF742)
VKPLGPGRVVPSYVLTGGRTRTVGHELPLEALVSTTGTGLSGVLDLQFEERAIVLLCRRPVSIAEVAARLALPLGVARVLVSDLSTGGCLAVHLPHDGERPDRELLERLLDGLRAL